MIRLWLLFLLSLSIFKNGYARVAPKATANMSGMHITGLCKDAQGLMWVGTHQDGIFMYDGYRFLEPINSNAEQRFITQLIYYKPLDIIYAATETGLSIVHCKNQTILPVKKSYGLPQLPIVDMCCLSSGHLCLHFNNGDVYVSFNKNFKLVKGFKLSPGLNSNILSDGPDKFVLYINGLKSPFQFNLPKRKLIQEIATDYLPLKIAGDTIFAESDDHGLKIVNKVTQEDIFPGNADIFAHFRNIRDVQVTSSGICYILAGFFNFRLYRMDFDSMKINIISDEIFVNRKATCFFIDPEGIIWIGTHSGLIQITKDQHNFRSSLVEHLPVNVRSIEHDELGNIYASTNSGLYVYKPGFKNWILKKRALSPALVVNVPGNYLFLFGTDNGSVSQMDKKTAQIKTKIQPVKNDEEGTYQFYSATNDGDDLILISSDQGIIQYQISKNVLSSFENPKWPKENSEIRFITKSKKNKLLICTQSGLYEFDRTRGIVWQINAKTTPALSVNAVNSVTEDTAGRLWLCTDGGINIISNDRKSVTTLKTEDGLSDNITYNLLWQTNEIAWISTFNGLCRYSLKSKTFDNYYVDDGLTSNKFNHNAFLKDTSGELFFGSINGINSFLPTDVVTVHIPSRLFASTITVWDNKTRSNILVPTSNVPATITLRPMDHSLTFNLALTNYHTPENNTFRYRIKGLLDDKWESLGNQSALKINGLRAGNFLLEIEALDCHGTPASNRLQYHIRVLQPFYKSWLFYLSITALIGLLIWLYFNQRLQQVKKVQNVKRRIERDLHDDIGSLLTSITMTSENLLLPNNSAFEKETKLEKIAALSRKAVSAMNDILWSSDVSNDRSENLADRFREHADEILLPLKIELHFEIRTSPNLHLPGLLRQHLYSIYKEAVNNIVKHSKAKIVHIRYCHTEHHFLLSITNDGLTKEILNAGTGQGLKNIVHRAEIIHATAIVKEHDGVFTITIVKK